jgi:hypothetical protein
MLVCLTLGLLEVVEEDVCVGENFSGLDACPQPMKVLTQPSSLL